MKKLFFYMGLFTWLFGCKTPDAGSEQNSDEETDSLPEMTSRFNAEEGWHDVYFRIVSSTSSDTTKTFVCKGLHKGKTVGLEIEVRLDIKAGINSSGELDSESGFKRSAVQLRTIGTESDELIKALSALFGFPTGKPFTKKTKWLTVYSLNQKPVDLSKRDIYKLKLFFDQDEDNYCELFLNINTSVNEIELNEKDEDYRENVVVHLTE